MRVVTSHVNPSFFRRQNLSADTGQEIKGEVDLFADTEQEMKGNFVVSYSLSTINFRLPKCHLCGKAINLWQMHAQMTNNTQGLIFVGLDLTRVKKRKTCKDLRSQSRTELSTADVYSLSPII